MASSFNPCRYRRQVRAGRDAREAQSAITYRAGGSVPRNREGIDFVPECFQTVDECGCNCLNVKGWALNSAVECHPHTVEVVGSNPTAPTT